MQKFKIRIVKYVLQMFHHWTTCTKEKCGIRPLGFQRVSVRIKNRTHEVATTLFSHYIISYETELVQKKRSSNIKRKAECRKTCACAFSCMGDVQVSNLIYCLKTKNARNMFFLARVSTQTIWLGDSCFPLVV